jgi:uncharacterized protein involved in exopolysaccharide biosynthesis
MTEGREALENYDSSVASHGEPLGVPPSSAGSAVHPARLLIILLRYRRVFLLTPSVLFLMVVTATLIGRRSYTATVAFTPVPSLSGAGAFSGLAAQIGVAIPGQSPEDSPLFYGDLVRTNQILKALATSEYRFLDSDTVITGTFISLYEIAKRTPDETLFEAMKMLRDEQLVVSPDRQTGIVTIRAKARWPELAQAMAQRTLDLISAHNQTSRRSNAAATRDFLSSRVDSAVVELRAAEDRMQRFLESNREFRTDPRLTFEHDRLDRRLRLSQEIYSGLVQAREQARLEAVRSTPSITVVEPPARPLRPDRRYLIIKGILALGFGFALALAYILAREAFLNNPPNPRDKRDLGEVLKSTRKDFAVLKRLPMLKDERPQDGSAT